MGEVIDAPPLGTLQDSQGSTFSVDGSDVALELTTVDTSADRDDGWQRFTLVFRGGEGLDGGTHRLSSDASGEFDVALSPKLVNPAADDAGAGEYEAVFAREDPDDATGSSGGVESTSTDSAGTTAVGAPAMGPQSYIGSVGLFAGNFSPRGYMYCSGQLIPVSQQQSLFSVVGTVYGGDGRTTFAVPDLRGRAPIGVGAGPGLSNHVIGEHAGTESVALTEAELAPHTHGSNLDLPVSGDTGEETTPDGNALAALPRGMDPIYTSGSTDGSMAVEGDISQTGTGTPFDTMSPYLAMTYVICVSGVYPPRS